VPRIGFAVASDALAALPERLAALKIEVAPAPALPAGLGISECLRLRDPDGNIVELAVWDGHAPSGKPANGAAVQVTDVCHVALEVSDLPLAEKFYTEALGLTPLHRDAGELGDGRAILRNGLGQLLILEAVDQLSERSLFCGPDPSTAPKIGSGRPHAGAHIAVSVTDDAAYEEITSNLRAWKVTTDGDVRAAERPTGERSEYFYDPAGNRLQLIVVTA
jgi:catechol 2,3-dioxygenase-like lactoylglutathione lyase family enzyme